jgi:hypothetical protein
VIEFVINNKDGSDDDLGVGKRVEVVDHEGNTIITTTSNPRSREERMASQAVQVRFGCIDDQQ